MDAEKDAAGKLLQERPNGVYAPTTMQKVSLFVHKFNCTIFDNLFKRSYMFLTKTVYACFNLLPNDMIPKGTMCKLLFFSLKLKFSHFCSMLKQNK